MFKVNESAVADKCSHYSSFLASKVRDREHPIQQEYVRLDLQDVWGLAIGRHGMTFRTNTIV